MNPLIPVLRASGAPNTPPVTGLVHAYNPGRIGAFFNGYNLYPFINLVKGGLFQHPTGGITGTGDEWPIIPAGGSIDYLIMATLNPNGGYFPPGAYKIKSTSGLTLTPPGGTGVTASSGPAVGLVTFTFTDPGFPAIGTVALVIHISNSTGGTLTLTDLVCCLASEEALLTSGEIFKPDFLATHAGASVLRVKDWMFQDELWYNLNRKVFADYGLQSETKPSFVTNNLGQGIAIPFSIMIKLCKKIGADCWLTLPSSGGTFWTWAVDGTITAVDRAPYGDFPKAHRFANGTKVGLPGFSYSGPLATALAPIQSLHDHAPYFVVNSTTNTFQVSLTLGGTPIVPSSGLPLTDIGATGFQTWVACDTWNRYTDLWAPMIQKCHDTDSTVRLWIEYGNEVWNGGYFNTPYCQFIDFLNSGSTDFATILGDGYAYASMKAWATAEAIYTPSSITRVFGMFTAGVTAKPLNNYIDPGIIHAGWTIGQILASTPTRSMCVLAPYMSPDINGHTFSNVTPEYLYQINGNSLTFSDSFWHSLFEGAPYPTGIGFQAAEVWMAQCKADRDAHAPGVPFSMYEWGHQVAFGGGGTAVLTDDQKLQVYTSFKGYIDGPGGLALYQEGYSRLSLPFAVAHIAHYWSAGGYTPVPGGGGLQYWGLQNTPIDTPRSAWFRSL